MHALWSCSRLKPVRLAVPFVQNSLAGLSSNFLDFLFACFSSAAQVQLEVLCVIFWRIWTGRNEMLHGNKPLVVEDFVPWSFLFHEDFVAANQRVGQTPDLVKVQNGIANALKQSLLEFDISKVPTLKETSKRLVKQCASLPLAIVTIASNLNGEKDKREWRNALNELTNNKDFIDYLDRSRVKLHDVARDMVLRYITSKSPLFMVKVGLHLKELPSGQDWKKDLDKIS
ncbi:hypothetical protein JRO89_XS09G0060700 [Xanthoceras sorbifolium]|uniref:NB-ARC domain-containing protein n=1 Tax=Xanthoceras sorbifolium TaxID=99658 RepID=A0ABQ8HKP4_9ROSI|nr:hypothetical protein JRO89_XS09G0060700 [Xanthoceras sorbifolium]